MYLAGAHSEIVVRLTTIEPDLESRMASGLQGLSGIDRFRALRRQRGLGIALFGAIQYMLPNRITSIPEIDFTLRFTRDWFEYPITRREAMHLFRLGFYPSNAALYNIAEHGHESYISDFARLKYGWAVNGETAEVLNDKAKLTDLLDQRGYDTVLPTEYGAVRDGEFTGTAEGIAALLREELALIIKPRHGGGGNNVHLCRYDGGTYLLDGNPINEQDLRSRFNDREYLVTEYCRPGEYIRSVFSDAASTIRIITMQPPDEDPFIAIATHRVGTAQSAPLDNFAAGGITTLINEDGVLQDGVCLREGTITKCEQHPDTGEQISGTCVPGWSTIKEEILTLAQSIPECPYVGWDLIVTAPGEMRIIEGNANTGLEIQLHRPILTDDRVRSFYEAHGFIPDDGPIDSIRSRLNTSNFRSWTQSRPRKQRTNHPSDTDQEGLVGGEGPIR